MLRSGVGNVAGKAGSSLHGCLDGTRYFSALNEPGPGYDEGELNSATFATI